MSTNASFILLMFIFKRCTSTSNALFRSYSSSHRSCSSFRSSLEALSGAMRRTGRVEQGIGLVSIGSSTSWSIKSVAPLRCFHPNATKSAFTGGLCSAGFFLAYYLLDFKICCMIFLSYLLQSQCGACTVRYYLVSRTTASLIIKLPVHLFYASR